MPGVYDINFIGYHRKSNPIQEKAHGTQKKNDRKTLRIGRNCAPTACLGAHAAFHVELKVLGRPISSTTPRAFAYSQNTPGIDAKLRIAEERLETLAKRRPGRQRLQ